MNRPDQACRHLRNGFPSAGEQGFKYYAKVTPKELREHAQEAVVNKICVDYCTRLLVQPALTAAAPIVFRCLGEFQVIRQGKPAVEAQWKGDGKMMKMLMKLLAAREGWKITWETLVDILWSDAPLDKHGQRFRTLARRTQNNVLDPAMRRRRTVPAFARKRVLSC
jgi:hypothetical protein